MNGIILKRKLYKTKTETSAVYSAEYDGEKCYAIVNNGTGFTAIFDYDKRVWESLKRFMREKKYSIAYDKDPSGMPRFKLVTAVSGRENIDFSSFTKIEISVPYGCSEMYKFETIYENYPHDEYGSYGYGMDRTFVLSDDGRE